jgi:hypothetical protein
MAKGQAAKNDTETYRGRLAADGAGNLLAYEAEVMGESVVPAFDSNGNALINPDGSQVMVSVPVVRFGDNHNKPVYHDTENNVYKYVAQGEPSHNQRAQLQVAQFEPTVSTEMIPEEGGDPSMVNSGDGENMHHFEVQPDDPHYDADSPRLTRLIQSPDTVAAVETGHTDAYTTEGGTG